MRRLLLAIAVVAVVQLGADAEQASELAAILERAGERVERYLARAETIVCLEFVHLQSLNSGPHGELHKPRAQFTTAGEAAR